MQRPSSRARHTTAGFSLIEMLVVLLLLSVVTGTVLSQISMVQQRSRTEQIKLDIFQESREFMDQMVRDLHQTGYPNIRMFDTSAWAPALSSPAMNDARLAAGLLKIAPNEIVFEGDVDGDGQVDVLDYKLVTTGNNCPCLQRSQVLKSTGGTVFSTEVQNVQNAGTNADPIFVAYQTDGTVVNAADSTTPTTLANIKTIQITLKLKAAVADPQTGVA
ncbi:MAG TPA: prepilin-type N-terminal cleavage/methylation domain-containing protein, partial [Candidatus Acidoferrales bacterium]|nr:prepilin-type N-terminal cleavage/methylation domain-containing protein [Candidatus Acidoferrales bacterium]